MKLQQTLLLGLVSLGLLATTGCLPPPKVLDVVEIKPNETAWAIPLDANAQAGQVKFDSVGFLNQKKVAAKRIMVDKVPRSTGRWWWEKEWIPTVLVVRVDRSLVTREWTDVDGTGTSGKDESIPVVTKDSVKLKVGLTVTASIDEDDASQYLYYHGDRKLCDVTDQNIRSFCVAELTRQYSELTLTEAQIQGASIYNKLFEDAKLAFKSKGITIQYLGNAEGLTYADPKVQDAINQRYVVEQSVKTAKMEQDAARIKNETLIMTAKATADAAKETFGAKEASELQTDLKIRLLMAEAQKEMATKWDGKLPSNILPANSPMLMNLSAPQSAVAK